MFERGDLVLIPFPFSDLSAAKKRPVLVMTRSDGSGDFVALAVTSRPQTDHGIALDSTDLVQRQSSARQLDSNRSGGDSQRQPRVKAFGRVSETVITAAVARLCAFVEHRL